MKISKGNTPNTRERIIKAISDMNEAGCKMTISGVAKEAGVSNATIHNRYPDLASRIRGLVNKATEQDAKKASLRRKGKAKTSKQQLQSLRNELDNIKKELADVYSVNFSLAQENESLKAKLKLQCKNNKK